jgi:hypothetical protein
LTRTAEINSTSRVQLIQELLILKLILRSHTMSNWGILGLLRKVKR